MSPRHPIKVLGNWANYLGGGVACGLGGTFVFGLPGVLLAALLYVADQWLRQRGFSPSQSVDWIWKLLAGPGVGKLPTLNLLPGVLLAPPVLGFAYGWWLGLHSGPKKLPTPNS